MRPWQLGESLTPLFESAVTWNSKNCARIVKRRSGRSILPFLSAASLRTSFQTARLLAGMGQPHLTARRPLYYFKSHDDQSATEKLYRGLARQD